MYAVIHVPSRKVMVHNGLFNDKRKAKLSMRNNTYRPYQHDYGIAEVDVIIKEDTIETVNKDTNKWERGL